MEISEKKIFMQLLSDTLASYGKGLPEGGILTAWWSNLSLYPMSVVRAAFQAYLDNNGEFAPLPAGIAMRCRLMDGRPSAEEAWAIALTGRKETDTVMWTQETAEAFAISRSVLESGVPGTVIGARMPFLEAYARLVNEARTARRPVQYLISPGWDAGKRDAAIARAKVAGLLVAPIMAGSLPAPIGEPLPNADARAQIDKIRKILALTAQEKEAEVARELEADWREGLEAKRKIAAQVARYQATSSLPKPSDGEDVVI